jgi:flagellar biosynthetic protein FlhB
VAEDNQDDSQKTEEPTHRRLEQAREKGQVARSQEVNHWFIILAAALVIGVFGESLTGGIVKALVPFVEQPHAIRIDGAQLRGLVVGVLGKLAAAVSLPVAVIMLAAFLAGVIQNGLVVSTETIIPKLEKLSLVKGLKRLFSVRSLVEFVKGLVKITIVAVVVMVILWPNRSVIPNITGMGVTEFMALVQEVAVRILIGVLSVMTVIAVLDFLFQKQQHLKQLRMSKQEMKEEFKQTEGDPMIKARLRQIRMERARKRMMAAVPEADVVITNPTHFAVALKYDQASMDAPVLTAKGMDTLALRMREIAEENEVPVVENPPLARALFDGVDLDQPIPPEHYKAVAEVIGYVMRLKAKLPPRHDAPGR